MAGIPNRRAMTAFRSDLNGLRALAVLAVVLFHAGVPGFGGGFVGVDVFFVISGYLMTDIILGGLERGRFTLFGFWTARARRILPALLCLCAVLFVFGWVFIDPITYREIGLHAAAALTFVSNVQFWRESGYFDESGAAKWLLHTWSLSVEWQFYLVYPVVLVVIRRWLGGRVVAPTLWCGFAASLVLSVLVSSWRPTLAFYMLPTRAWEMMAGGLILVHAPWFDRLSVAWRRGFEAGGFAILALAIGVITAALPWPSGWALGPVLGTAAVIAANRGSDSLLNTRAAQALGTWSYSIYLWHWPVIVAWRYFGWNGSAWAMAAEIGAGIALGALSFVAVERSSQAWLKRLPTSRTLALAVAAAAVLLAVAGLDVRQDGFVSRARQPDLFADLIAARVDWSFPDATCARAGTDRSVHVCRIGPGSDTGTLVIGDSHANQWYARVAARADADAVFVTRDGCPPLPNVVEPAGANCPDYYRVAMQAAAEGHYRRLIIAAFWPSYFRTGAGGGSICIRTAAGCVSPQQHPDAVRTVYDDFARDLDKLDPATEIVIVLPDLEPPGDLPMLLAKRAFFGQSADDVAQESRTAVLARTEEARSALLRVATMVGAKTVDPLDMQCGSSVCRFVDANGRSLFRDSNHLRSSIVRNDLAVLDPFLDKQSAGPAVQPTCSHHDRCALPVLIGDAQDNSVGFRSTLP